MSLLVTAFGRFEDGPNCSEALLARLDDERGALETLWGAPLSFALIEVDAEGVAAALARAVAAARPTHVLMLGQAAGRAAASFERVARNIRDLRAPDARGRTGALGPVRPGGPERLEATWPGLESAVEALAREGVAAELSNDAGTHLCNQMLYLAIEAGARADPPFVAAFLHLPLTPEQVAAGIPAAVARPACAALPLDDMARAVRGFLVHTRRATSARDRP